VTLARRRSTLPRIAITASDVSKSVELETRVGRVEVTIKQLGETVATIERRMFAIQAQLDHIAARLSQR
jgi:uncharacterized coiled-coil protein SlyX